MDFEQIGWDARCEAACRDLVRLAVREDLEDEYDWTTLSLAPAEAVAQAAVVARQAGVVAGVPAAAVTLNECDPRLVWTPLLEDGATVAAGDEVALIEGPARSLLTAERILLNLLGRLSGVATLTHRFVDASIGVQRDAKARVYDTRKTTPGWRRLEKYAVRQGGGRNHRMGLYDAVLIKDNHLALTAGADGSLTPAAAVAQARKFLAELRPQRSPAQSIVEVEVDSLEQFNNVLPAAPDIVLLDNFTVEQLRQAVAGRDARAPDVQLEASGGVNLETIGAIAATGVDRISVGALTHSATQLDLALDWR